MSLDNAAVNSRMVVVLIVIVGLICAISVIISAVALNKPSAPDVSINTNNHPIAADVLKAVLDHAKTISKRDVSHYDMKYVTHKPVYTVAMGYDNGAHDYRTADGSMDGFGHDLVDAVCDVMNMDCRKVYDKYQNCWTSTANQYASGGQGLLGGWYDACVGWASTKDRRNVFDFSSPYMAPTVAKFYVKTGNTMEMAELMKQKIGFVRGFAEDEQCLLQDATDLSHASIEYADTPRELIELLRSDVVSAIFSNEEVMAPYMNDIAMTTVPAIDVTCAESGNAVMARKDSPFLSLWNEGFEKLKKNGAFKNVCDENANIHGTRGLVKCNEG